MPAAEEQVQFLYLLLTQAGAPTIDWDPICAALQLKKDAATKRWSRLKQAMEKGEKPADSSLDFLWLLVKHANRDKSYDWEAIAKACGSTKGACSKRWSRLKLAFERGDAPPSTPSKAKSAPATPKKTPSKVVPKNVDGTPTTASKRKRAATKKTVDEGEDEDEEELATPKRAKSTPKTKPRPKNGFRASDEREAEPQIFIKGEPAEDSDVFVDAPEEVLPISGFAEAFTHAREMADVLLDGKAGLNAEDREELEGMRGVFDEEV